MTTLLQINASLFGEEGQSSRLSNQFVDGWQKSHPQGRITRRDLAAQPVPHLDGERFGAFIAKPETRTAAQQEIVAYSDSLIEELRAADVVVLGVPMYNFGVPTQLKAWFDHVARAGVSFRYTENGPVGLLGDKKVYVFTARGGLYAGTARDTATAWLRDMLAFLGFSDVEIVYAEGLAMGEDSRQESLNRAEQAVRLLIEPQRAAA